MPASDVADAIEHVADADVVAAAVEHDVADADIGASAEVAAVWPDTAFSARFAATA